MLEQAVVFPGQGSQSVGMLNELAAKYSMVEEMFAAVSTRLGYDLWNLVQQGPEDKLNQTEYTQVAVLTADVCVYKIFELEKPFPPKMMAGHSLGEYAALVCSGSINLVDAAEIVSIRGRLMQENVPLGLGAMAAIIGLTDEQTEEICHKASSDVELVTPANYNAHGQVVIAGHTAAVDRAIKLAEEAGARMAKIIPVSVPCHCALLKNAADKFSTALNKFTFKRPNCVVLSNVDLSVYDTDLQIKSLLKEQLYSPVQWVKIIDCMAKNGINSIIECGPGKVLSGLIKRIDKSINTDHALTGL